MNESNLANLPREAEPGKSDLVPDSGRTGPEGVVGLYEHTPSVFSITLRDVVEALKYRRLFLLLGVVAGFELAMLLLALTTPLYAVSARVVITQQDPDKLVDTDSGSSTFIATQAEVIQSPTVVQAAVATLPRPNHLEPEDDVVEVALDAVRASAITGTRVIALGYLGADANYGAALLTAMVEAYLNEVRETTRSGQAKLHTTKDTELEELLEEIAQQELKIKELRPGNAIIGGADEAAATQITRLNDHVQAFTEARNRRIELESRLASGSERQINADPLHKSLREDLRQAESELNLARKTLTNEHPTVVAAERNVQVLRSQLASSTYASQRALRQQIDEAARLEEELAAIDAQLQERLEVIELHRREENKLLAELDRMQSQADQWRRELFDQRLVSRLAQTGDVGIGARIIAKPVVPDEPVWPKKKFMLAAGTVIGLSIAFLLALVSLRRQRQPEVVEW